MKKTELILKEMNKNNGIITAARVKELGIDKKFLTILLEQESIERVNRGLYQLKDTLTDEDYAKLYGMKNAIYSHMTALYFHNLSNRVPMLYDVTVHKRYYGALCKDKKIVIHKIDKELLELGKIKILSPQGQEINVYDVERCLCDCLKDRKTIASEYLKKAFLLYFKEIRKDTFKLMKYAKKLGIEEEMHDYLEVLL